MMGDIKMGDKLNENYGSERDIGYTKKEYIFGLNKDELIAFAYIFLACILVYNVIMYIINY